jgi:hypothetical protein
MRGPSSLESALAKWTLNSSAMAATVPTAATISPVRAPGRSDLARRMVGPGSDTRSGYAEEPD